MGTPSFNQEIARKLDGLTGGEYEDLMVRKGHCPECLGKLQKKLDNNTVENVCVDCGLVYAAETFSNHIPFGAEHTPGNALAFNDGMGDSLQTKGLFSLLAQTIEGKGFKCPKCGAVFNDLPTRAQQTGILASKHEHPRMFGLKREGKILCETYGFGDRDNFVFSNYFGNMLKKMGATFIVEGRRQSNFQIASAIFVLVVRDLVSKEKSNELIIKLGITPEFLRQFAIAYNMAKDNGKKAKS